MGTAIARGAQVTLTGTASDTGGVVASIEVSTDGGSTWHPATGTTSWSYTFYAAAAGDLTVQVRGVDDSGNIGATPATRQFPLSGAHNLFGQRVPANPAVSDSNGVELYCDRAEEDWPRDPDGSLGMFTRPLDLESLLAEPEQA